MSVRASQQEPATRADESDAGRICDRHGAALFSLAYSVLLDRAEAERVVVSVIADVCIDHDVARDEVSMRKRLAYRTFVRCLSTGATAERGEMAAPAGRERVSMALVRFGGFSYRDVATLLDLPAAGVAGLLATGLRRSGPVRGEDGRRGRG